MVWSYHSQISRLTVATAKVYGFWCYNMAKFDFITSEQASSNCLLFHMKLLSLFAGHSQILSSSCGENRKKAWHHHYVTNQKWWTRFHNDGNGPCKIWPVQHFANNYGIHKYQVANEGCVDIYKWKALCMYVH